MLIIIAEQSVVGTNTQIDVTTTEQKSVMIQKGCTRT